MESEFRIFELSFQVALAAGAVVRNNPVVVVGDGVFRPLTIAALVVAGQVTTRLDFAGTH